MIEIRLAPEFKYVISNSQIIVPLNRYIFTQ